MSVNQVDVLIVGAGPTGLALAAELTRLGAGCRIVDRATSPAGTSRALGVQSRTLELLERFGLADPVIAKGRKIHGARFFSNGRQIAEIDFGGIRSRYPYVAIVPQSGTETLLGDCLSALGISVERGVEFTGLSQDAKGVEAVLRRGGFEERLRAGYVIGCDGAHSAVRHALELPFEGKAFLETFSLADLRLDWDGSDDHISGYLGGGDLMALFPLPDGRFRIVMQHGGAAEFPAEPAIEEFQAAIDDRGPRGARVSDAVWMTRFGISQRHVAHQRRGRVFLAGDAAHIHSPLGGQGMNTGIQDALNLAWKLALVIAGRARPALLDSYELERQPIAEALLRGTGLLSRIGLLRNPMIGAAREKLGGFLLSLEAVQQRIRDGISETALNYRKSPIVRGVHGGAGPQAGDRAPDAEGIELPNGRNVRLYEILGRRHVLLHWSGNGNRLVETIARDFAGLVDAFAVLSPQQAFGSPFCLRDRSGRLAQAYAPEADALYLIRPDNYVAFRGPASDEGALSDYLDGFFIGESATSLDTSA